MPVKLSEDRTRLCDDGPPFGVACYVGAVVPDPDGPTGERWDGDHVGILQDGELAERWLAGDPDVAPRRVFTQEQIDKATPTSRA